MKREEKSEAEKEENLGEKLRRGVLVGKRGGPTTPVVSTWRLCHPPEAHDSIIKENSHLSARKLAAALWEFHHYFPISKMHRGVVVNGASDSKMRRRHHRSQHQYKDKGLDLSHFLADPSPSSPEQVMFCFDELVDLSFCFYFFFLFHFMLPLIAALIEFC